jgi:signal recognition particle GTPase
VLDAVTGQNGLEQAKRFHEAVGLTGVIVTKLDGTGKGGILLPIARELGLPIRFVGVGEAPTTSSRTTPPPTCAPCSTSPRRGPRRARG